MHLISIRNLRADAAKYPDTLSPVDCWYRAVKSASWQNLEDAKQVFPTVEAVGNFTVFDIKGNNYRLIASIDYKIQTIYYKYFLTHAEYDKEDWKKDPYY